MKRAVLLTVENHLRQYRKLQRRQDREARAWCDAVRETLEEYETGGEPMKARLLVLRYFDGLTEEERRGLDHIRIVCIGGVTARALEKRGRKADIVAETYNIPGMTAAVVKDAAVSGDTREKR